MIRKSESRRSWGRLFLPALFVALAFTGHLTFSGGVLSLAILGKPMFQSTISTFRVADARVAETFYRDKLGFKTSWEFDPGDGSPVFVEVMRDAVAIHLSEHDGDGPEAVSIYVNVADAQALYEEITGKGVVIEAPPEAMPWRHVVFELQDPDGNIMRFGSPG